ncbi:hypothetical protein ACFRAE_09925 [Sphingobacterium sp. HJSM2_6]|uniref:hypothetical protein n=1 Tax=Sphingobacterium sp. HJSM2_6 TaxID=3366264 RepID=UPI003BE28DB1
MKNYFGVRMFFVYLFVLFSLVGAPQPSYSQCAMCSLNAENSTQHGNTQGKGLNAGILFLLAMPFLFAGGIGFLWYKKFRAPHSKSNLNLPPHNQ